MKADILPEFGRSILQIMFPSPTVTIGLLGRGGMYSDGTSDGLWAVLINVIGEPWTGLGLFHMKHPINTSTEAP